MSDKFTYEEAYKEGYLDGLEFISSMIDKALSNEDLNAMPSGMALRVLRASISPAWDDLIRTAE